MRHLRNALCQEIVTLPEIGVISRLFYSSPASSIVDNELSKPVINKPVNNQLSVLKDELSDCKGLILVHLSRRLKCTIVITRCPSSVRRYFFAFSTSSLKPLNKIQRNLTGSKNPTSSTKFVFFGSIGKNKMATLASDWLRHFQLLLWNRGTRFNETWQEARSQRLLPSLCFSGRSEKQDGHPGLWLAETFSTSSLKPLNGFQRNLTGSKISTSSIKFVFFGPIGKTRWPPWTLSGWDIFDFSSETAERNSTKLDRKQDLNVLYLLCFFY